MQVTNQMLSLVGSLLADPTNPPPPPEVPLVIPTTREDSPTPDPEPSAPRPVKKARVAKEAYQPSATAAIDAEPKEEIDVSFMNARELKQKRKDDLKKKNQARKDRKAGAELVEEQAAGAEMAVGMTGTEEAGKKRKGPDDDGGKKKKRK